jgi:flagella basal body P-ring formation protein FlgA
MQRSLLTLFLAASLSSAAAQVPTDVVRRFVESEMERIDGAARVDIVVGEPDSRLRLAPCERAEPYLRSGARLWGRSFVGLRCVAGAQWTVSIPVQVRVYGPALVAARTLAAGQPIGEADVRSEQIEWTSQPQGVARDPSDLQHRVPARPIEAGRPIGLALLTDVPAVALGDPVKVVGLGSGFSITTDAVALNAAPAGQPVRVRVESGKILTGTAREGRIVEVAF